MRGVGRLIIKRARIRAKYHAEPHASRVIATYARVFMCSVYVQCARISWYLILLNISNLQPRS